MFSADDDRRETDAATKPGFRGTRPFPAGRSSPLATRAEVASDTSSPNHSLSSSVSGSSNAAVEDRRFHRSVEELLGVTAEVLVETVLPGDVHGQAVPPASRPSPHLAQAGDGAGEGHADRRVEFTDVDAEFERVGGDDPQQPAFDQVVFDAAPLRRGVAGPVGRDLVSEVTAALALDPLGGELADQLDAAAALEETDRPHVVAHQVGQQVGRFGQR